MIEHLRDREKALEPLGWTGREAEWIALVCLHSGVFIRAQFCRYFDAHRQVALRFVQALKERKALVESNQLALNDGGRTCRISSKAIYRALGAENIRHRKPAGNAVMMRRLLSLDYVLEHPGLNWLPTEPEKVEFFKNLGVPSQLVPRRIYYGAVGAQKRYFALKLPVAGGADTVIFAYVDPGRDSNRCGIVLLGSGAWAALGCDSAPGAAGWKSIAIGAELDTVMRADRVLQLWASAEPGKSSQPASRSSRRWRRLNEAIDHRQDDGFLSAQYGGTQGPPLESGTWSFKNSRRPNLSGRGLY